MSADDEIDIFLREAFKERKAYFDELHGESDRAAAILAVASLDDELGNVIKAKFPAANSGTLWKRIYGPGKPISEFSTKANFARAFGIFGDETRSTLEKIGTVRNRFAHASHAIDFSHPRIVRLCEEIRRSSFTTMRETEKPNRKDVREFFLHTVQSIQESLERSRYYEAYEESAPKLLP